MSMEIAESTLTALLALAAILAGLWDLAVVTYFPSAPMVSVAVYSLARQHPIFAIMVGILIGHLFWPQSNGHNLKGD